METVAMDPAIHASLRAALSLLFLTAALHKLRDLAAFRAALHGYRLLPEGVTPAAAIVLIAAELGIACVLPWLPGNGAALAAVFLLATYTGAIAINLLRGRRAIDCGCAGPAARQPLSGALVVRNTLLCIAALSTALPIAPRVLQWIDILTIAGSVALLCLLYAAVNGLQVNLRAPAVEIDGVAS